VLVLHPLLLHPEITLYNTLLLLLLLCRLEHLQRVSAADAHAVLVLHPEGASDNAEGGADDNSSVSGQGGEVGGNDPGAAALKMQTIMALTAQLLGKKAAVVVQVGNGCHLGIDLFVSWLYGFFWLHFCILLFFVMWGSGGQ
jgi:hypothetical protein